jgi:nicotinamide phosphoribosyltransferase
MKNNIILLSDSYKVSHWKQYPPKTNKIYSYLESRGGRFSKTVFFGLQYILKEYLEGQVVTPYTINEAEGLYREHFGSDAVFNRAGWDHIRRDHDGFLPLSIKAVAEGTVVDTHNALITIENTCPKCYWLTNFVETLLVQAWYPITVATQSREIKKVIKESLDLTGDPAGIDFKLHDFGFRGVSSVESAAIGGAAHLVNFLGTDTVIALRMLRDYYSCRPIAGFSIPAAEHSTITSWGKEHEVDAMRNMLDQYPKGLVAVVSDSYNIFYACEKIWGGALRDKVLERDGVLIVRPDSGDPSIVIAQVLATLAEALGYTTNAKGFKVLNPKVRVIQGDGVDYDSITRILGGMVHSKWSTDNIAFGMGGALLQKLHRDTQKVAFKCAFAAGEGWERDVFKEPVTDSGKKSKRGRQKLLLDMDGGYYTVPVGEFPGLDQLHEVFLNGLVKVDHFFADVRDRAKL